MGKADIKMDWYGERVELQLSQAARDALMAIGFQVEGQTKANIVANGQVDTGFMLNSVYTVGDGSDTYGQAARSANSKSSEARMAPPVMPPEDGVAVAVGAEYAVFQEIKNSFLYRAVEQVAGEVAEAEIVRVAREQGLTE